MAGGVRDHGGDPRRTEPRVVGPGFHDRVFAVVRTVPPGRVTTYGDVAGALGSRRVARQVGYALAALPPDRDDVPWHRVVNGRGRLSPRAHGSPSDEQILRLRAEGIVIEPDGRIADFCTRRFRPESPSPNADPDVLQ
jgi:methylated-DNA-protein-cysteine methyltransferase-like protein